MEETITEAEYWFLDSVRRYTYALEVLTRETDYLEDFLNKPTHGLSYDELVEVLWRLFQDGDLIAARSDEQPCKYFTPTRAELEAGLRAREEISFGLTEQGGRRWEIASKPNWDLYLELRLLCEEKPRKNTPIIEVYSANRALLEEWLGPESPTRISVEWETLTPWQATYWKSLPRGYRLRVQEHGRPRAESLRQQERRMAIWQKIPGWYTHPWRTW